MTDERCETCRWFVRTYRDWGLCDLTEDTCVDRDWCTYYIEADMIDALEERDKAN